MRYFWLLDQEAQKYFKFVYQPGQENMGDCPTKHHTGPSHVHMRPYYLHLHNSPKVLPRAMKPSARQGCVKTLGDPYRKMVPLPRIPNNCALYSSTGKPVSVRGPTLSGKPQRTRVTTTAQLTAQCRHLDMQTDITRRQ